MARWRKYAAVELRRGASRFALDMCGPRALNVRGRLLPLLVALVIFGVATASAEADQRTGQILPFFNAERALNGLPAVGQVNRQQEVGCANHLRYMALNGGNLVHGENPSLPGYTPEGNYLNGAGGSEVLSSAPGWSQGHDPWETAPIHLYLMFNPAVTSTGYADDGRFVCQRMSESFADSAPLTFYAWTGSAGRLNVPYRVSAREAPYTPQQLVGIPPDQATGPNLMVFSAGNLGMPLAASLVGPSGPVDVRLVNERTQNSVGDGSWFRGGGIIIPTSPLAPGTAYVAAVAWADQGQAVTQTFAFKTAVRPVSPKRISLRLSARRGRIVTLKVAAAAIGRPARVRVTGRGHYDRRRSITLRASQRIRLPARTGPLRVTVTVDAFLVGGQPYRSAQVSRRYR